MFEGFRRYRRVFGQSYGSEHKRGVVFDAPLLQETPCFIHFEVISYYTSQRKTEKVNGIKLIRP